MKTRANAKFFLFMQWFEVSFTSMNYSIMVPTLNGGESWRRAAMAIHSQRPAPIRILVIDSGSTDKTVEIALEYGFEVQRIEVANFDHGGTRQKGVEALCPEEFIVLLTQDAVLLSDTAVSDLLSAFDNPDVGAAYGRQIAADNASIFEQHARAYNYPVQSIVKSKSSISGLGIKAAFCSNSFAAYRRSVLQEVGGFPDKTLFAEDMLVAARMILTGHSVAYQANAQCEHWHDYSIFEEFRRSFDIGVFHHREAWILQEFGKAQGEGARLIGEGFRIIIKQRPIELPVAMMKYLMKVLGYLTGRCESLIPSFLKRKISMNRSFWKTDV